MAKKKRPDGPDDDLGGLGVGGAALILILMAVAHPWQTVKELLPLARWLGRRALRFAQAPFRLLAAIFWLRWMERRPSFDEFLHRHDEDDRP